MASLIYDINFSVTEYLRSNVQMTEIEEAEASACLVALEPYLGVGGRDGFAVPDVAGISIELRESIIVEIQNLRALFSPIRRLPPEILGHVFTQYLNSVPYVQQGKSRSILLSCCYHWRIVTLHTPSLWSSIFIKSSHEAALIKQRLTRSGDVPLMISYQDSGKDIIDVLLAISKRWRRLEVDLTTAVMLLDNPTVSLPALESLEVRQSQDDKSLSQQEHRIIIPNNAYHFCNLILWRATSRNYPQLHLPWQQLTSLCIIGGQSSYCLNLLRQCPNLKNLELAWIEETCGFDPSKSPIELPFLTSWEFSSPLGSFFTHMKVPKLRVLAIAEQFDVQFSAHLSSLLSRSSSPLERVILDLSGIPQYAWIEILMECVPCIPISTALRIEPEEDLPEEVTKYLALRRVVTTAAY